MTFNPYFPRFIVASCHALGLPASALAQFMPDRRPMLGLPADCAEVMGVLSFGRPPRLRALDLRETQWVQIFRLCHEQAPRLKERAGIAARTRGELESLCADPNFDRARARQVARAHGEAVAAIVMLQAETIGTMRGLLTSEQLTKLDAMRGRRMEA